MGERGGSVVECRTPEREVGGSKPTAAVLCPWARHFTPRKYWLIAQEAVAPSRHDWKIVDWDVKPQHNQPYLSVSDKDFVSKHDFDFLSSAGNQIWTIFQHFTIASIYLSINLPYTKTIAFYISKIIFIRCD